MTDQLSIALPAGDGWTWEALQEIPDQQYHYYQLVEGQVLMSPSPNAMHQTTVLNLAMTFRRAVPREFRVFVSPFDFVPEPRTSLQPDVLVVRRDAVEKNRTVVPPVLVIEVLSPRNRTFDLTAKRALYERFGVTHYWIVDPEAPSILALALDDDGRYVEVATAAGSERFRAVAPFPVDIVPGTLVED